MIRIYIEDKNRTLYIDPVCILSIDLFQRSDCNELYIYTSIKSGDENIEYKEKYWDYNVALKRQQDLINSKKEEA